MPDIPAFVPLVDGAAADADTVSERLYEPKLTPDSLAVTNGQITNANRLAGWDIDRSLARKGFMSKGRTVGATANQDYFDDLVKDGETDITFNPLNTSDIAIPGCCVSFQVLPLDTTVFSGDVVAISFNWHISLISAFKPPTLLLGPANTSLPPGVGTQGNWPGVDGNFEAGRMINPTQNIELIFYINDFPVPQLTRRFTQGRQGIVWGDEFPSCQFNDIVLPDTRHWSGSFIFDNTTASKITGFPSGFNPNEPITNPMRPGWHTASIRLRFVSEGEIPSGETTTATNVGTQQVRVKTRRMSYTLIR